MNLSARLTTLLSLALAAVLIVLLNWRPALEVPLNISRFGHDSGFAYIGPVPSFGWGAYRFNGDDNDNLAQSGLVILEDGRPLGPAHTSHDAVRRQGAGSFSHWDDHNSPFIIFSTSDNTNPATNGRHYTASGRPSLLPVWRTLATAVLLAILLVNLYVQANRRGLLSDAGLESRKSSFEYRSDIDGLRAVAVTLVILFHLGFSWMPGGYVGVDVFFVISGYLITGIISRQIEAKTFSFLGFYQRRIKRIFPALFLIVAATLSAGIFLLLPGDYATTAKSGIYAVSASSNFYFLFNTGYFDAAAELMPLLHTWSLGVEEQFYVLWPALIVGVAAIFGRNGRATIIALLLVGFLSYICGVILVATDPKAAFYLPFTRGWEFVAGALLSQAAVARFQTKPVFASALTAIGLALIVISALVVTKDTPFPSWGTVLPVVGAALLVAPSQTHCFTRRLLSSWPFVFTGQVSYSLYLWHWPIITLYRHYNLDRPINVIEALFLISLITVASILSWRYVELPFRRASAPAWLSIGTGVATASALAAICFVIVSNLGFPQRMPPSARLYESREGMWEWKCPQEKDVVQFGDRKRACVLGANWETAKTRGILIGDSHAEHLAPLLDVAARAADVALVEPNFSCMPLVGPTSLKRFFPEMPTYNSVCAEAYAPIIDYIRARDDIQLVVLGAAWSGYPAELYRQDSDKRTTESGINLMREGIKEFAASLSHGHDRQFLIISDVPRRQPFDVGCLARSFLLIRPSCPEAMFFTQANSVFLQDQMAIDAMIRALPTQIPNVSVSIPHDHMCERDGCPTVLNDEFLYRDATHLRRNMTDRTKTELTDLLQLRQSIEHATAQLPQVRPPRGP